MKRYVLGFLLFTWLLPCAGSWSLLRSQPLSWQATPGPYATHITCFSSLGNTLFCGAGDGAGPGIYRSTDGGSSWVLITSGIINSLATGSAVTGAVMLYAAGASGVMISADSGATWVIRDTLFPLFSSGYSIVKSGSALYAALGTDGVFRSTNEGKLWSQPAALSGKTVTTIYATGSTLLLAEAYGLMISTNNGTQWSELGGDIPNHSFYSFTKLGASLFAGTDAGVFRSSDGGLTWNPFGSGISGNAIISCVMALNDSTLFAGASDGSSGIGIYRSVDTGNSWQLINSGLPDLSVNALFASGAAVFAGTNVGISRSVNTGNSWQIASSGLPKPAVNSLASMYTIIYAGTKGANVFFSDDHGSHWEVRKNGLTRPNVNAMLSSGLFLFAGTDAQPKNQKGGLHESTDYGRTWVQITKGIPIMSIHSIAQSGSRISVAGDSGVYSTMDNGNSWSKFTTEVPTQLYAKSLSLYEVLKYGLYKYSESAGWSVIPTGTLDSSIHAVCESGQYLFIGTDSGVYRSSDNGKNWSHVTGDSLHVNCLWENAMILAAGTTKGIYLSTDLGTTWKYQQSAGKVSVNVLGYGRINLYAGTDSGVVEAPIDQFGVTSSQKEDQLVLRITDPASMKARIHYAIPQASDITIAAYDLLGKECAIFYSGSREAGEYDIEANISALPSGSYIVVLRTNASNESVRRSGLNIIR